MIPIRLLDSRTEVSQTVPKFRVTRTYRPYRRYPIRLVECTAPKSSLGRRQIARRDHA